MPDYDFKLKFALPADCAPTDETVERLAKAGCDDALVGTGQSGRIALDFTRNAASAEKAILSALADVKKAIPGARLIEVSPDLVGLTEVADFVGMSRQNMRKLWLAYGTTFPVPTHEGSSALWHLALVLTWLKDRGTYQVQHSLLEVSHAAMQVNLVKEADHMTHSLPKRIRALVA